jgi:hypothetical protein
MSCKQQMVTVAMAHNLPPHIWYSGTGRLVRMSPERSSRIAKHGQGIDGSNHCSLQFSYSIYLLRQLLPVFGTRFGASQANRRTYIYI